MKLNIKTVARTFEHIALIAIISLGIGFYLGNQYGTRHIDLKALKQAPVASVAAPVSDTSPKQ